MKQSELNTLNLETTVFYRFIRKNIFKTDLSPYETAVIFGAESLMGDLVPKLSEMRPNTNLLACRFPLPENDAWKLVRVSPIVLQKDFCFRSIKLEKASMQYGFTEGYDNWKSWIRCRRSLFC